MNKHQRFPSCGATKWFRCIAVPPLALVLISLLAAGPVFAQPYGDAAAGGRLAAMWCTNCHQIGPMPGNRASDAIPSFRAVANMPSTTALSIRVFLRTSHPTMPDLMLTEKQIDDIGSYILGLRDPPPK